MEERDFYVYIIRHPTTNQPFYVGKGKGDRYLQHWDNKERSYDRGTNKLVKKQMTRLKHDGLLPLYEVINELTELQAFSYETKLIQQYGRVINQTGVLLNITEGGRGGRQPDSIIKQISDTNLNKKKGIPVMCYDLDGNVIREYHSAKEAERKTGTTASNITACCKEKMFSANGFRWSYDGFSLTRDHRNRVGVKQIDTSTGRVVGVYNTIDSAAISAGVFSSSIRSVLSGKTKTAGGFKWEYLDECRTVVPIPKRTPKQVFAFHPIDKIITEFASVKEAAISNEVSYQAIHRSCKQKTICKNHYFSFENAFAI